MAELYDAKDEYIRAMEETIVEQAARLAAAEAAGNQAFERGVMRGREESRARLSEATKLLYDWDVTTFGRAGSVVEETRAFLKKVGYTAGSTPDRGKK